MVMDSLWSLINNSDDLQFPVLFIKNDLHINAYIKGTTRVMTTDAKEPLNFKSDFDQIKSDLIEFAIDREDIKFLLSRWPDEAAVSAPKVDYELQLLKMIAVGWSLSFYLREHPVKNALQETYWLAIKEFAGSLSETTGLMIGKDIDYFAELKQRLDHYVTAMGRHSEDVDPSQVVAPEFAELCGRREDIFVQMAGGKMFSNTLMRVKQYLIAVKLL